MNKKKGNSKEDSSSLDISEKKQLQKKAVKKNLSDALRKNLLRRKSTKLK